MRIATVWAIDFSPPGGFTGTLDTAGRLAERLGPRLVPSPGTPDFGELPSGLSLRVEDSQAGEGQREGSRASYHRIPDVEEPSPRPSPTAYVGEGED